MFANENFVRKQTCYRSIMGGYNSHELQTFQYYDMKASDAQVILAQLRLSVMPNPDHIPYFHISQYCDSSI